MIALLYCGLDKSLREAAGTKTAFEILIRARRIDFCGQTYIMPTVK
jgi:hypothetical protein